MLLKVRHDVPHVDVSMRTSQLVPYLKGRCPQVGFSLSKMTDGWEEDEASKTEGRVDSTPWWPI